MDIYTHVKEWIGDLGVRSGRVENGEKRGRMDGERRGKGYLVRPLMAGVQPPGVVLLIPLETLRHLFTQSE